MTSFKCDTAASRTKSLLHEWDSGSTSVRRSILQDFVAQNQRKTAPELEAQFADVASLLLTRFTSWLRLTYPSSSVHTTPPTKSNSTPSTLSNSSPPRFCRCAAEAVRPLKLFLFNNRSSGNSSYLYIKRISTGLRRRCQTKRCLVDRRESLHCISCRIL